MEVSKRWKMVEFSKIWIKMKNCKTFCEDQTAIRVKEIIKPLYHPSPEPEKILLRLWNRYFLTEIYRYIQTFAFKVLEECSSLGSKNDAVQMFSDTKQKSVDWKIRKVNFRKVKFIKFLVVLREHIAFNVKWLEFHKISEVFWAKLYCKMNELFR